MNTFNTGIGPPAIPLITVLLVLTAIGIIVYVLFASRRNRGSLRERLPSVGAVVWILPVVAVTGFLMLKTLQTMRDGVVVAREVAVPSASAFPREPASSDRLIRYDRPQTFAGTHDAPPEHVVTSDTIRQERERLQKVLQDTQAEVRRLAAEEVKSALQQAELARARAASEAAQAILDSLSEISISDIGGSGLSVKLAVNKTNESGETDSTEEPSTDDVFETDGDSVDENGAWTVAERELPEWVTQPPQQRGNTTLLTVGSKQYSTVEEAEQEALKIAAYKLREDFQRFYPNSRGNWTVPQDLAQTAVRKQHVETIQRRTSTSQTPFEVKRVYLQVELSDSVRNNFFQSWREQIVQRRLWTLGSVVGMLTLMFGTGTMYFRLDARTGGAYRRRLKLAAVSLIVAGGLVAAAVA